VLGAPAKSAAPRGWLRTEFWGLVLLACALAFNAWYVAPEVRINRVPLNDVVFHLTASERLGESIAHGEPFLNPWVSEWALGYPVWQSYQPLPHLVSAFLFGVFHWAAGSTAIFAVFLYLLIVLLPASVYAGARLLGLSPPAAGLAALLVYATSSNGNLGSYGSGYGAYLWRGSGLFTQLFAMHLLVIAIGMVSRALDLGGSARKGGASLVVALTSLSHIIFGYTAFVSAALLAVVGPRGRRSERLSRLVTVAVSAIVLFAWFLIPLFLSKGIVNHSRWEAPEKWNSYGAPFILHALFSGQMFDLDRFPWLSGLVVLGIAGAVIAWREPLARRLMGLTALWLVLFFGRATWGHLIVLAGVPGDLPLHRLQTVFELSTILMASYGICQMAAWIGKWKRDAAIALGVVVAFAVICIEVDRAGYLEKNKQWGEENLAAYEQNRSDLDQAMNDVRAILAQRPGRVSAGLAATWGNDFKIGSVPIFSFLSREHFDQASFLYHAMSKSSDIMVLRDENNRAHDVLFGIRAVVAPAERQMPSYLKKRSVHGQLAVYESSPEGYFGVVDIGAHYAGPASTEYEASAAWMKSTLQPWGIVVSLDSRVQTGPALKRWEPMPAPSAELAGRQGRVISESKINEVYQARIEVNRPAYALVKLTWSPDLQATVDGNAAQFISVTPGFGAVAIPAGQHDVVVRFKPSLLRPLLLVLGAGLWGFVWLFSGKLKIDELEKRVAGWAATAGKRLASARIGSAAILLLLATVALHPLFQGKLISGHDAVCYPPRIVEFAKVVLEGHLPLWAPDLSAGHGQPLFEFSPPLVYVAALPFRVLRFSLADSIQLGLAALFFLGTIAFYRVGRMLTTSRAAALGGAAAWLFAPYLALDLYVRSAFSESAAIAILPIALLALLRALERPGLARVSLGAIAISLLLLAHNAISLMAIPAFVLTGALLSAATWHENESLPWMRRIAPAAAGVVAIVLAVGISAYFWIPAVFEKGLVHIERMNQGQLNWSQNFAVLQEIIWSPWGFGTSGPGATKGMSLAVGPLHIALAAAGLVFALRSARKRSKAYAAAFALAAVVGAWLSTSGALFLWQHVKTLQYMQFPWRALVLPALFLPLLAIFAFERLGPKWTLVAVLALALFNLRHTEPHGYLTFDDDYFAPQSIAAKGINTTTSEEFEPQWVESRPPYDQAGLAGVDSIVGVNEDLRTSSRQVYRVKADRQSFIQSSTFFYPGWEVSVDGSKVPVSVVQTLGLMQFAIPAGQHQVVLELKNTPVRTAALRITQVSLLVILAFFLCFLIARGKRWMTGSVKQPWKAPVIVLAVVFAGLYVAVGPARTLRRAAGPAPAAVDLSKPDSTPAPAAAHDKLDLQPRLNCDSPAECFRAGNRFWRAGDKADAMRIWEAAAKRYPRDSSFPRNIAFGLYSQGDYSGSIRAYRRALAIAPNEISIQTDFAWALLAAKRLDEARSLCLEVLAREPGNTAAKSVLSRIKAVQTPVAK
jgi:hypothetical protein